MEFLLLEGVDRGKNDDVSLFLVYEEDIDLSIGIKMFVFKRLG